MIGFSVQLHYRLFREQFYGTADSINSATARTQWLVNRVKGQSNHAEFTKKYSKNVTKIFLDIHHGPKNVALFHFTACINCTFLKKFVQW